MPKNVTPDIKILRSIRWLGSAIAGLLLLLNVLIIVFLVGSAGMQKTTVEMMDLTRDMNASTSETMARLDELLSGVTPEDVAAIVASARLVTADVSSIVGPIARHGNVSSFVSGVQAIAGAIDARAVASAVANAASIMSNANNGVQALHPVILARRVVEISQILDPVVLRGVLGDIVNVTSETRKIVDGLARTHTVELRL
jgi:hypothetical protein